MPVLGVLSGTTIDIPEIVHSFGGGMNLLGNALIFVALISSILSAILYYRSTASTSQTLRNPRRWLKIGSGAIVAVSALLLMLLMQHDFSNHYVYSYSSRTLPLHFLISSFYAGQEGSFVFWVLCSALIGLALMRYSGRRQSEQWVMTVFMGVQSFLLLIVYAKTPFKTVWEVIPQIPVDQIPADGRGLNPLLQNFWMVIHPPVLFVGFAAMAIPFTFAIAGMWKKDYALLSGQAFGWLLFAILILGAGIMLGAYWAYGVLGWGGYWGWDPVENSSLIPWIIAVALAHTLIVQRRTGKFLRSNLALAILSFLLVVYSTFLTRSGVLGDSSVHAFVDPGAAVYWLLILFLVAIVAIGFGFMIVRRKELRPTHVDNQFVSKETALAAGAVALVLSAAVILFGTSLPLAGKSTVDTSFYDTMNLPLAIVVVLFIGFSLYIQWGNDEGKEVLKRAVKWLAVSLGASIVLFLFGIRAFDTLLLVLASLFALCVNLEFGWKQGATDLKAIGGKLAHIGLAMFFLGVIASGKYSSTTHVSLELNHPQQTLGHTLTYVGYEPTADGKYAFNVNVEYNGKAFRLSPLMFDAGQQGTMRNPDIASSLTGDFYLSPVSLEEPISDQADHGDIYTIEKGKAVSLGQFRATFVRFDMNSHSEGATMNGGGMSVGSVLELTDGNRMETITPVTVYLPDGRQTSRPSQSKLLDATVQLVSMNVGGMGSSNSAITIDVRREGETTRKMEVLVVEVSTKPFIGLVWLGSVVMFFGFILAGIRRLREG